MKLTAGGLFCAALGMVIGLGGVLLIQTPSPQKHEVASAAPTTTAVIKIAAKKADTIDALYPFFASGVTWTSKISVTLPPRSSYNPTDQTIAGYQVTSLPTASTEDIGGTVEPLRNYYDQLLVKNGWHIAVNFSADGAGGSVWGFTKDNQVLILSYTSTFMNQQPNTPEQCPCTVQFTLIGGELK